MADNFLRHRHLWSHDGQQAKTFAQRVSWGSPSPTRCTAGFGTMLGRCGWLQLCISCVFEFVFVFVFVYFPKESAEAPRPTRCEGDLGTMLGSCGWPHRHSVWKAEWHTHYQTTSPFSDHTSAGPWPCSSSNDWDQHIWNDMVSCGWLTIVTTQLVLVRNTSSNMFGLVTTLHIGESVNLLHQPYWW